MILIIYIFLFIFINKAGFFYTNSFLHNDDENPISKYSNRDKHNEIIDENKYI